ncbi:MAG: hypothetical protein IPK70_02000 [Flavobacteriales bacterium]|nr:hypothetical protein [Flavobacteriales bacterium]
MKRWVQLGLVVLAGALVFVFFSVDLGPRVEYVEEQPLEDTVVVPFRRLRLMASPWTAS